MNNDELDRDINLIYETVTEPSRWHECLESIAKTINAKSGVIGLDDLQKNHLITGTRVGFTIDMLAEYQAFRGKDIWVEALKELESKFFLLSHELVPQREYIASEAFETLARKLDIYHTIGIHLNRSDDTALRIAFQRGKSQGYYGSQEAAYLNRLLPHIKRALSLSKQLHDTQLSTAMTENMFEKLEYAVLLVNSNGKIIKTNKITETILSTKKLLKTQHNQLRSIYGIQDGDLSCALASVCQTENLEKLDACFPFLVSKQQDSLENIWLIEISRFQVSVDTTRFKLSNHQDEPFALISVRELSNNSTSLNKRLKTLYELSASEIDIAVALSEGHSPKEIAENRCRSIETIRTQIKQVIAKMGAKKTTDLVALVNKISF